MYRPDGLRNPGPPDVTDVKGAKEYSLGVRRGVIAGDHGGGWWSARGVVLVVWDSP